MLAVEIKRFQGGTNQTLVPRVIGRTARGAKGRRGPGGGRLTRELFLEGFADDSVRGVAETFLDAAEEAGAKIEYSRSFGLSIRVRCEGIRQLISVAWLYSREGTGWMRTRDFSFGAALYAHDLPGDKLSHVEGCLHELRNAAFTLNASSKGVHAWAVEHEVAVEHREFLTDMLQRLIAGLGS